MELAEALAALSLLHAGFQSTVTVVVYPALAATPADGWPPVHAAHSRRISLLVAPLYLVALAVCLTVAIRGPWTVGTLTALFGNALAGLVTALVAGPAHGRLAGGRSEDHLTRLRRADAVRLAGALLAAGGGLVVLAED